jgi:hypothetical protein
MQSAYRYTSGVPHPKPPRPRHRVSYTTLFLAGLATLTLLILLGLLVFAFLYLQVFGLILPGIQVGDIPLGGMNREKAAHKLDQAWNHNRSLIISDGTRVWSASPADFGLWIDTQSAVEQAYQFGRGPAASSEIRQLISGNAPNYVPIVRFFPEIARPQLERWAPLIQMEPQEAALVYEDGQWQALPGKNGIRLDIPLTLQHIQSEQTQIAAGGFCR